MKNNRHPQDVCMEEIMLTASFNTLQRIRLAELESALADEELESTKIFAEWKPAHVDRKENRKQRRSARRKQNARHKKSDRLHGKGTYVYHYKEDGELKEAISGNEYRNWATWVRTMHSWGDPEGKKRRVPRTQSVSVHKDTKPIPEQEPTYVGFYGTLEVRKGITVTMEWNVPEAVKEEPV